MSGTTAPVIAGAAVTGTQTLYAYFDPDNGAAAVIRFSFVASDIEATVPGTFTLGMWSLADAGTGGTLNVTINSLPGNGGAAITDIEYTLDGGDNWISSGGTTDFAISGLTDDVPQAVAIRAVNSVGAGASSLPRTVTPTAPASPSMPFLDDTVMLFKAEDLALTDGAGVASWVDSVNGAEAIQATGANQPVYRANVLNGLPGLEFNQSHWLNVGRPAAMLDAMSHYNDTTGCTLFFVLNVGANPTGIGNFRAFWCPEGAVTDGQRSYVASSTFCGPWGQRREKASGGFRVIVVKRSSLTSNQTTQGHFFDNMGGIANGNVAPHASANYFLGGAGNGTASQHYVGHVHEFGCINRELTSAEVCQLVKFFHDKYGQPYPWAGLDCFNIFDGDSQTYGVGTTAVGNNAGVQAAWPNVLMLAKSVPYEGWRSYAIGSRTSGQMTASIDRHFAGLQEELGIPLIIHAFEYYNQVQTNAAQMKAYLAALRAAAPNAIIVVGTSIDNGQVSPDVHMTSRASFNAALATSTDYDILVPLHEDETVGIEGACPDDPGPYDPNFTDGIHCTNAGYAAIAAFWAPYHDEAVEMLP